MNTSQYKETKKMTFNGGSAKDGGYFTTYTGKKYNPIHPTLNMVCIEDVARSLSNICRFGGHVQTFYSVAQHSVHVSELCNTADAKEGLLHDAPEGYIGDMVRPLKYTDAMTPFREIEEINEKVIVEKFKLQSIMPPSVKYADNVTVVAEALRLFTPHPQWALDALKKNPHPFKLTEIWSPDEARSRFMNRYLELFHT